MLTSPQSLREQNHVVKQVKVMNHKQTSSENTSVRSRTAVAVLLSMYLCVCSALMRVRDLAAAQQEAAEAAWRVRLEAAARRDKSRLCHRPLGQDGRRLSGSQDGHGGSNDPQEGGVEWEVERRTPAENTCAFNARSSYWAVGARGGCGLGFTAPLIPPLH